VNVFGGMTTRCFACVAVCFSALIWAAACCSVVRCVAVMYILHTRGRSHRHENEMLKDKVYLPLSERELVGGGGGRSYRQWDERTQGGRGLGDRGGGNGHLSHIMQSFAVAAGTRWVAVLYDLSRYVVVCCSVLYCVPVCCGVLRWVGRWFPLLLHSVFFCCSWQHV